MYPESIVRRSWTSCLVAFALLALTIAQVPATSDGLSLDAEAFARSIVSDSGVHGRVAFVNGIALIFHPATEEDIERLGQRYGEAIDGDYPAVVEGRSTGFSAPDRESLAGMIGKLMIVDDIIPGADPTPATFDLSDRPTFPAVGDQASQPSCSAWAGTYYAYGFLEAEDNSWTGANSGDESQLLSPAWTYNKVNGGKDRGSWVGENMLIVRDWGAATMAEMPFDDEEFLDWGQPSAFREAPLHRAAEVFDISYDSNLVDDIKQLVFSGTPVTFGIDAYEYRPAFEDGNFIVSSSEYNSLSLNHAQTIVGFDDSVDDDGDVGAFRVVNSWGPDWGDDGYYWLTYDTFDEIGPLDNQAMNYIVDVADYEPTLLSVWHFDDSATRRSGITVGIGPVSSPLTEKVPFYVADTTPSHTYPAFMCLDISEAEDFYPGSSEEFFLSIGPFSDAGVISSFKIERYETSFLPGHATQASEQSPDVPASTPGTVVCTFDYYLPISVADAVDVPSIGHSTYGGAAWVGVPHESTVGGSSLRSGDVADLHESVFEVQASGPAEVSFDWMVSSEPGKDMLVFETSESGVVAQVSGGVGWQEVATSLGVGDHVLTWTYMKDASASESGDCGWIDNLAFGSIIPPPTVQLEDRYDAVYNELFTISPLALANPSGSELVVKYDWGDGTPWSVGDPGDSYSASHAYMSVASFTLAVYVTDDYGHNVSDSASIQVADANQRPSIVSVGSSLSGSFVAPGTTVQITLTVVDPEGDILEASFDPGTGAPVLSDSADAEPGEELEFRFSYEYTASRDEPYEVVLVVYDDQEHFGGEWDSREVVVLVNNAPVASLTVEPSSAATGEEVTADASGSFDTETAAQDLLVRWDWDGDGTWDSEWSSDKVTTITYYVPGDYTLIVEVRDSAGLTDSHETLISVTGEAIPEFSGLWVPALLAVVAIILVASLGRARRGRA